MTARRLLTALALFALFVTGCTVDVPFEPIGTDVSLDGSWTINGAPATAEACNNAGISEVGLVFFHGGATHKQEKLVFPCAGGAFSTDPILAFGDFDVQWQAYDANKKSIDIPSNRFSLDVRTATHVVLDPVDFVTTSA